MDAAHKARSPKVDRSTKEEQTTLNCLQKNFLAGFVDKDGERKLHSDAYVAQFVPAILAITVKLAESNAGSARSLTSEEILHIRARKAAELSSAVPHFLMDHETTYEHCETRRLLWKEMLGGLLACGNEGEKFDREVASALLFPERLSARETEIFVQVLQDCFANSPASCMSSRFLLSLVKSPSDFQPEIIETIVRSCVGYSNSDTLPEIVEALKKTPVTHD